MLRFLYRGALAIVISIGFSMLSIGSAYADPGEMETHHFDEKWGTADVSAHHYGRWVLVTASNVTSTSGCVKLKYKADRRGWVNPPDSHDSVGDLARICSDDSAPSAGGEHRVQLEALVSLDHVSFEFCKIRTLRSDDCSTIRLEPEPA